jgi:hypothetical protein
MRIRFRLLTTLALAVLATSITSATVFTVSNTNDLGAGSLRRAITDANADNSATAGSPHLIDATGISGTITLQSELPMITNHMSIEGPGASTLTIARGGTDEYSVFTIFGTMTVVMADMTITNGYNSVGAGVNNKRGTLTMNDCVVTANEAWAHGGGIYNDNGTLTMNDCIVSANISALIAGGIYNGGTMTMTRTTLSDNSATQAHGGGIANSETMTIISSTISGSSAGGYGGGMFNSGTVSLTNSTISGNSAVEDGGGILMDNGTVTLTSSTLADNSTQASGGGIHIRTGTVSPLNTIIAGNTDVAGAPDIHGAVSSLGHNIIGNSTDNSGWVASDLQNADPDLGPLQDNGGPTETMALGCGSGNPAVDAGDNSGATAADQRGEDRVVPGDCDATAIIDIGAYELQAIPTIRLATSALELSSANHGYQTIDLDDIIADVTGDCATYDVGDVVITTVTSDEPEDGNGNGDGNTVDDIAIAGNCRSVGLRAERDGGGNGRVYRIHLAVADCENASQAEVTVSVRKGAGAAVEGPVAYTENSSCSVAPKQTVRMPGSEYRLSMLENYPNPFGASTVIGYSIGVAGPVRLMVVDLVGRTIASLVDEVQSPGEYSVLFKSGELPAGTYYYVLESNAERRVGSMKIVK